MWMKEENGELQENLEAMLDWMFSPASAAATTTIIVVIVIIVMLCHDFGCLSL